MTQDDFHFQVFMPFVDSHRYNKDAAKALKVSKSYLSKMVAGTMPISKAVAKRLGYQAHYEPVYVPAAKCPALMGLK